MPFVLFIMGLVLIVTAFQNTYKQFGALVAGDFTGKNNFIYWFLAIAVVGAIGYIKPLEPFSRGFMVLIVLSIVLSNQKNFDFIGKFQSALGTESNKVDSVIGVALAGNSGGTSGGSSGGGLSSIGSDISLATTVASFF